MPDGSRKRRFSDNPAKRAYYAQHRSIRLMLLMADPDKLLALCEIVEIRYSERVEFFIHL